MDTLKYFGRPGSMPQRKMSNSSSSHHARCVTIRAPLEPVGSNQRGRIANDYCHSKRCARVIWSLLTQPAAEQRIGGGDTGNLPKRGRSAQPLDTLRVGSKVGCIQANDHLIVVPRYRADLPQIGIQALSDSTPESESPGFI